MSFYSKTALVLRFLVCNFAVGFLLRELRVLFLERDLTYIAILFNNLISSKNRTINI